jgi:hypothetical protein
MFGEWLGCPWIFAAGGHCDRPPLDKMHDEFCEAVKQMNAEHPGISSRVFTLDRWYDIIHYLLSETRRQSEFDAEADDRGTRAIRGTRTLPRHLRGGQGHPIRYSSPEEVAEIAIWMGSLTLDYLRFFYDPEQMRNRVYKFGSDDPDWEWEIIGQYFRDFKMFYEEVAMRDEAVLAVVT